MRLGVPDTCVHAWQAATEREASTSGLQMWGSYRTLLDMDALQQRQQQLHQISPPSDT